MPAVCNGLLLGRESENRMRHRRAPGACIDAMTWARVCLSWSIPYTHAIVLAMRSSVSLKSFEQGGEKWQADPVDWIWFDEQPPEDVYFEGITRTNRTFGLQCV